MGNLVYPTNRVAQCTLRRKKSEKIKRQDEKNKFACRSFNEENRSKWSNALSLSSNCLLSSFSGTIELQSKGSFWCNFWDVFKMQKLAQYRTVLHDQRAESSTRFILLFHRYFFKSDYGSSIDRLEVKSSMKPLEIRDTIASKPKHS